MCGIRGTDMHRLQHAHGAVGTCRGKVPARLETDGGAALFKSLFFHRAMLCFSKLF